MVDDEFVNSVSHFFFFFFRRPCVTGGFWDHLRAPLMRVG